MSSVILCSQLSTIVAHVHRATLDTSKYLHLKPIQLDTLREKETQLRMEIYRATGFPAFQFCETNEPCVSQK